MKVLVLGGAGYVGRVLLEQLRAAGHSPSVIDLCLFSAPAELTPVADVKVADTRALSLADFEDVETVIDLAAISNDPAGELDPELTHRINATTRRRSAELARLAGVRRYVLVSSCSVYGANDEIVTETAPLNPLTAYARCNALAESDVLKLNSPHFGVTVFRLATVFGPSPSMRFDLVVNTMALNAFQVGGLRVTGGGEQFRPLVHVNDVAGAILTGLDDPAERMVGEIFNLGGFNMTMREVAAAVQRGVGRPLEITIDASTIDHRNYRVSFEKAYRAFGFVPRHTVEDGAASVVRALEDGSLRSSPLSIRLNGFRRHITEFAV